MATLLLLPAHHGEGPGRLSLLTSSMPGRGICTLSMAILLFHTKRSSAVTSAQIQRFWKALAAVSKILNTSNDFHRAFMSLSVLRFVIAVTSIAVILLALIQMLTFHANRAAANKRSE